MKQIKNPIQEKWLRDETWQRLVDNEMTPGELRELVDACEQHTELWKCCAVAFIQEQVLQSELEQFTSQWRSEAVPAAAAAAAAYEFSEPYPKTAFTLSRSKHASLPDASQTSSLSHLSLSHSSPSHSSLSHSSPSHYSLLNSLALAASLTLALLIGWQAAKRFGVQSNSVANRGSQAPAANHESQLHSENQLVGQQLPTSSNDGDIRDSASMSALLSTDITPSIRSGNQLFLLDKRMPEQLAELQQRGLVSIESTEGFVPVQLINGNTAVVPIQQLYVRSVRHTY